MVAKASSYQVMNSLCTVRHSREVKKLGSDMNDLL